MPAWIGRGELLRATGLEPFSDRPAGKLSGGMKQKLGLCCALIHDPDLLVLEEPTTGVDRLSRRQFWEFIERIRDDRPGMSLLVATDYIEGAARFDGFLGSNGCGKTPTIKMLTGLLPASDGEAWLFGHPVNPHDVETRRRVG